MKLVEPDNIEEIFKALNSQIKIHGGIPLSLVVCGGTALAALGLILRTTKDVDVLGMAVKKKAGLSIEKIEKFPEWLIAAANKVERDFDLPAAWLNLGPVSQLDLGLPEGFEKRLVKRIYGEHLTIYYISRLDQIHFKLYASIDRDDYHVQDLIALKPTEEEMEMAARWVLTQDVSDEFKIILKDFLERNGYATIAQRV